MQAKVGVVIIDISFSFSLVLCILCCEKLCVLKFLPRFQCLSLFLFRFSVSYVLSGRCLCPRECGLLSKRTG